MGLSIADLNQRITVAEVMERYGRPLNSRDMTNCPFHDDSTPSFGPIPDAPHKFHCLGCGESGDVVDLVQHLENTDRRGAVSLLQSWVGHSPIPLHRPERKPTPQGPPIPRDRVAAMNGQLLANRTAMRYLLERRGLTEETVKRYLLGYDRESGRIAFPVFDEAGECRNLRKYAWTPKQRELPGLKMLNHVVYDGDKREPNGKRVVKFRYGEARLYPVEALKGDEILLCEGEADTLLARQMGLNALTWTSGVGSWQTKWNVAFAGKTVYIMFDQDPPDEKGNCPGQDNAQDVARHLLRAGARVKVIDLPVAATKDDKDLTDWVLKDGGTADTLHALIQDTPWFGDDSPKMVEADELPESAVQRVLPGAPCHAADVVPYGWDLSEHGVHRITLSQDGAEKRVPVFPQPVVIAESIQDVDASTAYLDVRFQSARGWRGIVAERTTFADKNRIIQHSAQHLLVNSSNSRGLVDYLTSYLGANELTIRERIAFSTCGWKDHQGQRYFVLGREIIGGVTSDRLTVQTHSPGDEQIMVGVGATGGTLKEWLKAVNLVRNLPVPMFTLYAGFAAPLLGLLGEGNFMVHLAGETSTGKSTSLLLAGSAWGDVDKHRSSYWGSWDSTIVGLEGRAAVLNNVPVLLDDSQTVADKIGHRAVYQLVNGAGRTRGNPQGLRTTKAWNTVFLSTGEGGAADFSSYSGSSARIVTITGSPLGANGGDLANVIRDLCTANYGHAGPVFLRYVMEMGIDNLRATFAEFRQHYSNKELRAAGGAAGRLASACAAVELAGMLVNHLFDLHADQRQIVESVFDVASGELEGRDTAQQAFDLVKGWLIGNRSRLYDKGNFDQGNDPSGGWLGLIREGEYVAVFPDRLKRFLEDTGFASEHILRLWQDRKWLSTDSTGKRAKVIWFAGSATRMYVIPWAAWSQGHDQVA